MWTSDAIIELKKELSILTFQTIKFNTDSIAELIKDLDSNTAALVKAISSVDIANAILRSAETRDAKFDLLIASVNKLTATVKRLVKPPNPGPLKLRITEEVLKSHTPNKDQAMADILNFTIQLPAPPQEPNDIVNGQLTVQIGDETQVVMTSKAQTEVVGLSGVQDAIVNLSFVYIDDSGNMSAEPSTLIGTLVDTFAPPAPGVLGLIITGETTVEEPAVEPEPPAEDPIPVVDEPAVDEPIVDEPDTDNTTPV